MLKIAITGNIAAGKGYVCDMFEEMFNIPIYNSDRRSKDLVNTNQGLRNNLCALLGMKTFNDDGSYNAEHVTNTAFNDVGIKVKMEQLFLDQVKIDFEQWCKKLEDIHPYIIMESAILFEVGAQNMVDIIVGVDCPTYLRKERLMRRNGFTEEQAELMMNAQMNNDEKMCLCDCVIENDDDSYVENEIYRLHNLLNKFAKIMK